MTADPSADMSARRAESLAEESPVFQQEPTHASDDDRTGAPSFQKPSVPQASASGGFNLSFPFEGVLPPPHF